MTEYGAKVRLFEETAPVAKALGNGKRLELLDLLCQAERTVEALARAAGLGVTTTSAHLQQLKRAGLVRTRREGTRVYYRIGGEDVVALVTQLREVATAHVADVELAAAEFLGPETDRVSREELLRRVETDEVTVVDVRPREEYDAGHIPGAVSIPLEELADRLTEISADADIVAYCRGAYCVLAPKAVRMLTAEGRRASRLDTGMIEWRIAGLPIETAA